MKRYLTLFFLLITSIALCAYPEGAINNIDGSALGWDEANQVWRPIAVDATGKLSSGSNPAVASISIDTSNIESYLKTDVGSSGSPNIKNISELIASVFKAYDSNYNGGLTVQYLLNTINSTVNGIAYVLGGNIGTDVGAIKTDVSRIAKGSQSNRLYMNRLSVGANSHYRISPLGSSAIDNGRVFVELRAIDPDAEFYIGLDAMVTDLTGRPVKGRILINISADQDLYIYHTNASALAIQQTEGWN